MAKKIMNKGLQVYKIKKHLKKLGIEPDIIDVEALTDSTLTYKENLNNILNQIKQNPEAITEAEAKAIDKIEEIEKKRSKRAKSLDLKKKAKNTISIEDIAINEKALKKYEKYPNKMDIEGIDAPLNIKSDEDIKEEIKRSGWDIDNYLWLGLLALGFITIKRMKRETNQFI